MYGGAQTGIKSKRTQEKFVAFVLLVCFALIPLLSNMYLMIHTCHDHDHHGIEDSCMICTNILAAKDLIRQIGTAANGILFSLANLFLSLMALRVVLSSRRFQTLVNLNVRSNA